MNNNNETPVQSEPARPAIRPAIIAAGAVLLGGHAIVLATVWNRLPALVAVQFWFDGTPTRSVPKGEFAAGTLLFLAVELAVMSWAATFARRGLAAFVLGLAVLETMLVEAVLHHNLGGSGSALVVVELVMGLALVATGVGLVLTRKASRAGAEAGLPRNPTRARAATVAEFRHRSAGVAIGVLPLLLLQAWVWRTPGTLPKVIALLVGMVVLWVAALAGRGFRYLVRADGLLVNGLVRNIVFISREQIRRIEVDSVEALDVGGWGIRGSGRRRAFIWRSGPGVRVVVDGGAVFLASGQATALAAALESIRSTGGETR
jgi:hypothetical protein